MYYKFWIYACLTSYLLHLIVYILYFNPTIWISQVYYCSRNARFTILIRLPGFNQKVLWLANVLSVGQAQILYFKIFDLAWQLWHFCYWLIMFRESYDRFWGTIFFPHFDTVFFINQCWPCNNWSRFYFRSWTISTYLPTPFNLTTWLVFWFQWKLYKFQLNSKCY